ncbi:MAG: YqgE/AlgH family protein [Thermoguttaceae bacterium]|jgi:putative transcriptional regulator
MESLAGHLLLASPHLADPNFVHTVVLLIQHDDQGALGLVLNRPTSKTVRDLWHQVGEAACESTRAVHLGGPVSGPLMAIHNVVDIAEMEIAPGVFFAAKKQHLDQLVTRDDELFRIFIGHAGWGPGQLESEIEQGAWRATPAAPTDVFDDAEGLWERVWQRLEGGALASILKLKHVPPDPSLN